MDGGIRGHDRKKGSASSERKSHDSYKQGQNKDNIAQMKDHKKKNSKSSQEQDDYDGYNIKISESSPGKSNGGENEPMLYVDVNLGNSGTQRIVVFEGDTAEGLAEKFSQEHDIDETMKNKLIQMLQTQIAGVLEKIDEE